MPTPIFQNGHAGYWKDKSMSDEHRKKIGLGNKGKKKSLTEEQRQVMRDNLNKRRKIGKDAYNYIEDRTKLKGYFGNDSEDRRSYQYKDWRKAVWLRDNFTCKIANPDCKGRIEAHHILSWSNYPELRYQVNNGITLCHAHHPRKRKDEAELSPYFQKLVAEMN